MRVHYKHFDHGSFLNAPLLSVAGSRLISTCQICHLSLWQADTFGPTLDGSCSQMHNAY